jgi:methylene-tetrahydromethanopterin dehydrogenase
MQRLELKPLKNKTLKLILIESEFPIDWFLESPLAKEDIRANGFLMSKEYMDFIENLLKKYKPEFVVEDKGMKEFDSLHYEDQFVDLFRKYKIPYEMVDIPDNALDYITTGLSGKKSLIEKFNIEISKYKEKGGVHPNDPHYQQLIMWREYLKDDYESQENEIRFKIRESWMMMGILDIAKKIEKKDLTGLFICDERHFNGISILADDLGVDYEKINIKKVAKNLGDEVTIQDLVNNSVLEIMPIKVKKKQKEEKMLYFFDTDDYASPFDINMAYDAGFSVVVPFCQMTANKVSQLVQDAMFSRKPSAPTVYFVGGSNVEESEKIAKKVMNALVPPFEAPVIMDPRGSHTTATAVVAKTLEIARNHKMTDLSGKKVVILGGTGPVGQIGALIASKLHCNTVITSRREDFVKKLAKELTKKAGKDASEINGEAVANDEQKFEIIKDADIIWSVGKAGIQMISKELMKKLPSNKIVVDINLVPPYGIEGLKPEHNDKEIYPGIYGIGALDIGRLKYKIESGIFKEATKTKGKKVFDYEIAFNIAYKLLFGEEITVSH